MRSGYLNPAVEILVSRILYFYYCNFISLKESIFTKKEMLYLTPLRNTSSLIGNYYFNSIYAVLRL